MGLDVGLDWEKNKKGCSHIEQQIWGGLNNRHEANVMNRSQEIPAAVHQQACLPAHAKPAAATTRDLKAKTSLK